MDAALTVSIQSGQTRSEPFVLDRGAAIVGIRFPAAFDGSSIQIEVSFDSGTSWQQLCDPAGVAVSMPVVTGKAVIVNPAYTYPIRMARFVVTAQSADRMLWIATEKVS